MNKLTSGARLTIYILAVIICATALYYLIRNDAITLGLDLQGGTYVLLEAESKDGAPLTKKLMNDTEAVIRGRVDSSGTLAAEIAREGSNRIRVSIPGAEDLEEVFSLLSRQGIFELKELIPTKPFELEAAPFKALKEGETLENCIIGKTIASREILIDASIEYINNKQVLMLHLTEEVSRIFHEHLKAIYLGGCDKSGIVYTLDDEVLFYGLFQISPKITRPFEDVGGIQQPFRGIEEKATRRIVNILKSGIMPVNLSAKEVRTIGPSLGRESLQKSLVAGIAGILLVFLFMGVAYRKFGLTANLALVSYLIIIMFLLIMFKVTFTLYGVAGLILGIGMAVDANIIIFERINEEVRAGLPIVESVEIGFRQAKETIIDANATTLLVAGILFLFGSGLIRGFAVTLSISILVSMFSALYITRWLLTQAIDGGIIASFHSGFHN